MGAHEGAEAPVGKQQGASCSEAADVRDDEDEDVVGQVGEAGDGHGTTGGRWSKATSEVGLLRFVPSPEGNGSEILHVRLGQRSFVIKSDLLGCPQPERG